MARCKFCDSDETECEMGVIGHTYCCVGCNETGKAYELKKTGEEWREWEVFD